MLRWRRARWSRCRWSETTSAGWRTEGDDDGKRRPRPAGAAASEHNRRAARTRLESRTAREAEQAKEETRAGAAPLPARVAGGGRHLGVLGRQLRKVPGPGGQIPPDGVHMRPGTSGMRVRHCAARRPHRSVPPRLRPVDANPMRVARRTLACAQTRAGAPEGKSELHITRIALCYNRAMAGGGVDGTRDAPETSKGWRGRLAKGCQAGVPGHSGCRSWSANKARCSSGWWLYSAIDRVIPFQEHVRGASFGTRTWRSILL